jgi:hypothetical protein
MFRIVLQYLMAAIGTIIPCLVTHTWTTRVAVPGLTALPADAPLAVTGDYAVEVEIPVAAGATNVEVDVGSIDHTKIASVVINADLAAMDIFTNAADGTGGQHIVLAANKSLAWNNTLTYTNPITTNITKFFANNSGLKAGVFRAAFLMNS